MQTEECIICFYDKPLEDYLYFGCGHRVCSNCHHLMQNTCPLCRYALEAGPEPIHSLNEVRVTISETITDTPVSYSRVRELMFMICYIVIISTIYSFVVIKINT